MNKQYEQQATEGASVTSGVMDGSLDVLAAMPALTALR
jgi:hypothetical protein